MAFIAHISDDNRTETVCEHTERASFLGRHYGDICRVGNLVFCVMAVHDVGKEKDSFQVYIYSDPETQRKMRGSVKHSSTGAKFIYDLYKSKNEILAEVMAYVTAAHHSMFDCVNSQHEDVFLDRVTNVMSYDEAIQNAMGDYLDRYDFDVLYKGALHDFCDIRNDMRKSFDEMRLRYTNAKLPLKIINHRLYRYVSFMNFGFVRMVLSCAIMSDWEASRDFNCEINTFHREFLDTDAVFRQVRENFDIYIENLRNSAKAKNLQGRELALYNARNALLDECLDFAKNPAGIYRLLMAVGSGKTLSGLGYGIEFAVQHSGTRKIIYCSPYIKVTRQNTGVFDSVIQNPELLLEYHSGLTTEDDIERFSNLMLSGWTEPFISTTFNQLFYALFNNKGKNIRLFQAFANAVLIIDEVQLIPAETLNTLTCMLNYLHDVMGTCVILCSATQQNMDTTDYPLFLSDGCDIIKDPDKWLPIFARNHFTYVREYFNDASLADYVIGNMQRYVSSLVILNTKHAVERFAKELELRGITVFCLSTNLCMQHQQDVLARIFDMLSEKQPFVAVSTNLIECGVDISFNCVYRSMAPLPNIVQSDGRSNRSFEYGCGEVFIINLGGENTHVMTDFQKSVRITRQVIEMADQAGELNQIMLSKWMSKYYDLYNQVFRSHMNFSIKDQDETIMDLCTVGYSCDNQQKGRKLNQAFATVGKYYEIVDDTGFPVIVLYGNALDVVQEIRSTNDYSLMRKDLKLLQMKYTVNIRESIYKKLSGFMHVLSDRFSDIMVLDGSAYDEKFGVCLPES